jgi:SAM-dependent methyltransferase
MGVVSGWLKHIIEYTKDPNILVGKTILELGPGPDIGTGLLLLALGAKKYITIDAHQLVDRNPKMLYEKLFVSCRIKYENADTGFAQQCLNEFYSGKNDHICYLADKAFDISKVGDKIDIVFIQAAFEHFDDIPKTLTQLSEVVKPGGIFISEIDLKTHSAWIRDRDPLNIYRYSDWFYRLCSFKGSPNRVRAFEYKRLLEQVGWQDVKIFPLKILEKNYAESTKPFLAKKFRSLESEELILLSVTLTARKK